jgi:hypothetical protein
MGNPLGRALMGQFNPLVNYFIPATHKRRKVTDTEMAHYRHTTSTSEQRRASATQPGDLVGARHFFVQLVEHIEPVSELPTLIIWGDSDLIFTDKYRTRLEKTFPNHSTTTLRRVGHYPMSDAPEEFASTIRSWHPHTRTLDTPESLDVRDSSEPSPFSRNETVAVVSVCNTLFLVAEQFDLDLLDDADPFEIDTQSAHLFKHPHSASTTSMMSGPRTHCSIPPNRRPTG